MTDSDDRKWPPDFNLPGASPADLRGRQSVRATFKLPAECIDAISVLAKHLGIKQKSLFDHLTEDMKSLISIAREVGDREVHRGNRIQKTFVISRRSLYCLQRVSKDYNAPRDALVEYSVQRLLPLIAAERRKQNVRKELLGEIEAHFRRGMQLMARADGLLGGEDPLLDSLSSVVGTYRHALRDMAAVVEHGKLIELLEPEMFAQLLDEAPE